MANCACPDLEVPAPRHGEPTIPVEPIRCACCGEPLELTCAGRCGKTHVRASMAAAGRRLGAMHPASAATPTKQPHECGRCFRPLPKATGRPRKFCDDCLTPAERKDLEYKRRWNKDHRLPAAS